MANQLPLSFGAYGMGARLSFTLDFCNVGVDKLVRSQETPVFVIPAKAGIQEIQSRRGGSDGPPVLTRPSGLAF